MWGIIANHGSGYSHLRNSSSHSLAKAAAAAARMNVATRALSVLPSSMIIPVSPIRAPQGEPLSRGHHSPPPYDTHGGIAKLTSGWKSPSRSFVTSSFAATTTLPFHHGQPYQRNQRQFFSSQPLGNIFNNAQQQQQRVPGQTLEQYGVDLTKLAKENKLDPVIGRHEEIRRTLQILGA